MSRDEKIELAMDIWDSIPDEEKPGLTEAQKQEIDRRMRRIENGEEKFYTWEEVKAKIGNNSKA